MKTISKIIHCIVVVGSWILMMALCCFYKRFPEKELIVCAMMVVLGFMLTMHKERSEKKEEKNILDFEKGVLRGRIGSLKHALYRTRKDRDKYKELYLSEKERADRHRERLREKRNELFKLKNTNQ